MDENQVVDSAMTEQAVEEKLVPQSQVNKIVVREKEAAAARARAQAEAEYQQRLEAISQQQNQRNETVSRDVDADAIYQQVQERFNSEQAKLQEQMRQQQLEEQMSQVAQNYVSKMTAARSSYDDFDEITADYDPTAFPQLTYLLAGMENAGDVVYELAKNPTKLANLDTLALRSPKLAQAEMQKLARSIADNRQAQSDATSQGVNAPLDRLQPSRVSGSNGKMGISDLRSQPWLKG